MDVEGFKAYVLSKWAKIEGTLPGLSLSQTGQDEATFILGYSHPDLPGHEQRIIIGRPATVRAADYMGAKGRAKESGFVDEEIVDGGENVPLAEMVKIVECWRAGKRYEPPAPVRR